MKKKAIILCSGGLDSATIAAIAIDSGFDIFCLTFDYGQRHGREIESARAVARFFNASKHVITKIDSSMFKGSSLTDDIPVPKDGAFSGIPTTYVPARNLLFISFGVAWAESVGARDLFIGVNAVDYSGYPDCRPQFIEAVSRAAELGTKCGDEGDPIAILAPLSGLSKSEIIRKGVSLKVDYSITHSCYDPTQEGLSCGLCDSCRIRLKAFEEAGFKDPISYARE